MVMVISAYCKKVYKEVALMDSDLVRVCFAIVMQSVLKKVVSNIVRASARVPAEGVGNMHL